MLDETFRIVHVALKITKGHLRLDHPEFGEVTRCVRLLRAKGGTKGVDISECACICLGRQLPRNSEESSSVVETVDVNVILAS